MRDSIRQWVVIFLLLWAGEGFAEPLYLSQMKSAQVDTTETDKIIKKLRKYRPIERAPPLKLSPFHNQMTTQGELKRDFCVSCHSAIPHRKNERLRSYLNMHINHLACASCHFRPDGMAFTYRWHPWGSHTKGGASLLITPLYQAQPVTPAADDPEVAKMLETWEESDVDEQARQHQRIHGPLQKEATSCNSCHTTEASLLDFEQLDYDEEEINAIRNDRIARFLGDKAYEDKSIKLRDLLQ
jgi:RNase P subunit RPR2